jgi:hypothetical protein
MRIFDMAPSSARPYRVTLDEEMTPRGAESSLHFPCRPRRFHHVINSDKVFGTHTRLGTASIPARTVRNTPPHSGFDLSGLDQLAAQLRRRDLRNIDLRGGEPAAFDRGLFQRCRSGGWVSYFSYSAFSRIDPVEGLGSKSSEFQPKSYLQITRQTEPGCWAFARTPIGNRRDYKCSY